MYHPLGRGFKTSAIAALVCTASSALGADNTLTPLEEIVVTAERRAQSLQDVPLSISAITGDSLNALKVNRSEDLMGLVPNLNIAKSNLGRSRTIIRGIGGSAGDNPGMNQKVALFIDDVYVARQAGMDTALFDLERIEVLRGPQGTLYGQNSIAGAINIHSVKPDQEFRAKAQLDLGNYDTVNTRFLVNGGLTNTVSAKLVLGNNKHGGFGDNQFSGDEVTETETYFGRLQFRYEHDNWDVLATLDYEDNPEVDYPASFMNGNAGDFFTLLGGAIRIPTSKTFSDDVQDAYNDFAGYQEQEQGGFSLNASYAFDNFTLTSITAYRTLDSNAARDVDTQSREVLAFYNGGEVDLSQELTLDTDQFSQEFRISGDYGDSIFYTAGLFYFREQSERSETSFGTAIPLAPLDPLVEDYHFQDIDSTSTAIYGQMTWAVTDRLNLTAGVRLSWDEKEADNIAEGRGAVSLTIDENADGSVGYRNSVDDSWDDISPKLTLDYALSDDHMVYATFARGYLSGGINFASSNLEQAEDESIFDPEVADNYEVGIKGSLLDGRATYSVSAFLIDYEDLQFQSASETGQTLTTNAATAESKGVEIELTAALSDRLSAMLAYGYTDAAYKDFCDGGVDVTAGGDDCVDANGDPALDASGVQLQYAPEDTASATLEYALPLSESELSLVLNAAYQSRWIGETDENPLIGNGGSYWLYNASLTWRGDYMPLELGLWGRNLADEEYFTDCFGGFGDTTFAVTCRSGAPRTYGVSLVYNFE